MLSTLLAVLKSPLKIASSRRHLGKFDSLRGGDALHGRVDRGPSVRQDSGKAEAGQHAVVEAGHRADAVAGEGEHQQSVGMGDAGQRVPEVDTEGGLAVGPGRYQPEMRPGRNTAARNRAADSRPWYSSGSGGMVSQTSSVSRATTPSTSPVS